MSVAARRILKNAGFLMISQMITWGMTLALTVVMARYLGPTGLGQLRIADSIWIILMMLVGFGTDVLLTKEIARDPAGTGELFGTAIVMRCLLFVGVLGLRRPRRQRHPALPAPRGVRGRPRRPRPEIASRPLTARPPPEGNRP